MRKMSSMIIKEFRHIFRDPPMIAIIFLIPVIQLFLLAHAITVDVKHIKLILMDFDRSKLSYEIVNSFQHTDRFDVIGFANDNSQRNIEEYFKKWKAQMVIVIPPAFSKALVRGLKPQIQISLDGVDGNSASVARGYTQAILTQLGSDLMLHPKMRRELQNVHIAVMEDRMWYNLDLNSKQYMVPGIAVVLLTILPMMLSAMSLVREKELGTLEQLMVTPLKKYELLSGKLIPFLILSFIELAILLFFSITAFKIPMNGSYFLLGFLAFLYLFTTLGLGIFISTITHSQQQAMFLAYFFMIFMILMSGFFVPIENMPQSLQKLTYIDPMRYFVAIVRDIFQKGSSLSFLLKDTIPMTAFGLLIFSFSVIKFQKRIK